MAAASALVLIRFLLAADVQFVCPPYPALAIRGGDVVAVLEIAGGSVSGVRILHGDPPFVEPSLAALRQWRLPPGRRDGPALVVVNFRDPYLVTTRTTDGILLGPRERVIKTIRTPPGVPQPTLVVDPLYGESLTVTGASVLHLAVSAKGSVEKVDVIRELGDLTASTVEAVKKWKLLAAVDKAGNPVESDAFAVCVYRPLERRGTQDSQSARAVSQVSKSYGIS